MSMFTVESAPQLHNAASRGSVIHADGGIIDNLTNRELAILGLLAERLQNKEIARRLFVSPETVKSHMKKLFQKLEVHNRRDAAAMAIEILASNDAAHH